MVTTADDPQGRPTVVELVPAEPRVFPVGRLDADTEGLLLLTNDGELTHRLTHPSFGVEKEYLAEVEGAPTRAALRRLREGVELDDGAHRAGQGVAASPPTLLRLTIHEGRNRQVRRMCEAVGHPVVRLVRTRIGPLTDRRLPAGGVAGARRRRGRAPSSGRPPAPADGRRLGPDAGRPVRCARRGDLPVLRALRGATTVDADTREQITERVVALLERDARAQRGRTTTT